MNGCIDFSTVVRLSEMRGDSDTDTALLQGMAAEARAFLESFSWCSGIADAYFGCGVGGVVGVFLFRIVPAREDVDECLWVIVGDLPPAYLVTDENRTPSQALRAYISEVRGWVVAAETGGPVEELIPVNVPATRENAMLLETRLSFLEKEILPSCP
jgi:hypothetical protein